MVESLCRLRHGLGCEYDAHFDHLLLFASFDGQEMYLLCSPRYNGRHSMAFFSLKDSSAS